MHSQNPSTWEAKTGWLLGDGGQPGLHCKTSSENLNSEDHKETPQSSSHCATPREDSDKEPSVVTPFNIPNYGDLLCCAVSSLFFCKHIAKLPPSFLLFVCASAP